MNPQISRVLVHINAKNLITPALFHNCLFNQLFNDYNNEVRKKVKCLLSDNKLILENIPTTVCINKDNSNCFVIGHPSFCPVLNINQQEINSIPQNVLDRGVDVGVAIILETSDMMVLITKRAKHMRTFPGVWVPPGGHIEIDETLEDAGLRELFEETGLKFNPEEMNEGRILGLWESVFPPVLNNGLPRRHHIVVYMHFLLNRTKKDVEKTLKLDPKEVEACIWLPHSIVRSVVRGTALPTNLKYLECTVVSDEGVHSTTTIEASVLEGKMPPVGADIERMSTGTRFALELWLNQKENSSSIPSNL